MGSRKGGTRGSDVTIGHPGTQDAHPGSRQLNVRAGVGRRPDMVGRIYCRDANDIGECRRIKRLVGRLIATGSYENGPGRVLLSVAAAITPATAVP